MSDPLFWTSEGMPIPAVTAEQMREVDRIAVEDFGLGILQMMENAGRNLAAEILIWVVLLPIMVGLWIWSSSWPVLVQLLGVAGLVGWTALAVSGFVRAVR